MTLPEFRAWLEGYENAFPTQLDIVTERMIPVPTPEQWVELKAKLAVVETNVIEVIDSAPWPQISGKAPIFGFFS